ncbi:Uma2 family endonuclease [Armatimonas rosea]|uniref:Uma2 family endonuclease n=1 Tax=Armatimonas rosea TaxID=685828 RepID=A0A7W9W524_ARMRO|nr:Uma2 family endonuclease [Armatimonas rosea]MBB6048465.1 Uma2 family endonuclease [Armatimonas rosea]
MATTTASETLPESVWPLILRMRPGLRLTDPEEFYDFCQANAPWQFERTAKGELIVTMPTGGESGKRNALLNYQLVGWALRDGSGSYFDSNTGFELPGGAMRAPDAAWVTNARLAALSPEQKEKFLPLLPDFVIELRSKTDRLAPLQEKMEEWRDTGVRLSLLLDPTTRRVHVYRPGTEPQILEDPATVDCSPELPGFLLDTKAIFDVTL